MSLKRKILYLISPIFFLSLSQSAQAKSNLSDPVNRLFWVVTVISAIVLLLVLVLWGWFIYRFREGNETERQEIPHSTSKKLEMGWTGVAAVIVIALMIVSYPVLVTSIDDASEEANGIPVVVEGRQWSWYFHYNGNTIEPGDDVENRPADIDPEAEWTEIKLPIDQTYTFTFMSSDPVMHSFYVHELNIKMDVIPGQNNTLTFTIQETGVFEILCAEYCGSPHPYMRGAIVGVVA